MESTRRKPDKADTVWMALAALAGLLVIIGLYLSLLWAPEAANLGTVTERLVQRVFYFHVSSGWVGFFAFLVTAVAGIVYLRTGRRHWDAIALSSVEIGITFVTANVVSGSIWARPTWNTWWPWNDPRITSAAIVWLIYVAYLMLRNAVEDPERQARMASVYGIVGFISVPITFLSIRWWRTIHPAVIGTASASAKGGFDLAPGMVVTLLFSIFTFTVVYFVLLRYRLRLEKLRDEVHVLKARVMD